MFYKNFRAPESNYERESETNHNEKKKQFNKYEGYSQIIKSKKYL